jgi:hypothetical protein
MKSWLVKITNQVIGERIKQLLLLWFVTLTKSLIDSNTISMLYTYVRFTESHQEFN